MIDVNVRCIEFPNMAAPALVCPNDDNTYDIYINALFCDSRQEEALYHELTHLYANHFYDDRAVLR